MEMTQGYRTANSFIIGGPRMGTTFLMLLLTAKNGRPLGKPDSTGQFRSPPYLEEANRITRFCEYGERDVSGKDRNRDAILSAPIEQIYEEMDRAVGRPWVFKMPDFQMNALKLEYVRRMWDSVYSINRNPFDFLISGYWIENASWFHGLHGKKDQERWGHHLLAEAYNRVLLHQKELSGVGGVHCIRYEELKEKAARFGFEPPPEARTQLEIYYDYNTLRRKKDKSCWEDIPEYIRREFLQTLDLALIYSVGYSLEPPVAESP